ncbi:MAG: hypothetical protein Q9192_004914 [Flavoplaca navasiana]
MSKTTPKQPSQSPADTHNNGISDPQYTVDLTAAHRALALAQNPQNPQNPRNHQSSSKTYQSSGAYDNYLPTPLHHEPDSPSQQPRGQAEREMEDMRPGKTVKRSTSQRSLGTEVVKRRESERDEQGKRVGRGEGDGRQGSGMEVEGKRGERKKGPRAREEDEEGRSWRGLSWCLCM